MKTNKLIFNNKNKIYPIGKAILYLTIVLCFEQSFLLKVDISIFVLNLYRISILLLWLCFLSRILLNKAKIGISNIRVKNYILFLTLWLLYAIFSLMWVATINEAIKSISYLFIGFSIIFFEVFYFKNLRDFKRLYTILLFILLIMIILGFINSFTGHYLIEYWNDNKYRFGIFPPVGVFSDQNDYAVYLVLNIPFVLVFIRYSKNIIKKFLGIGVLICAIYLLIITRCRASFLALLFEIGFWLFFLIKSKVKIKFLITAIFFILILYIVSFGYLQSSFKIFIEEIQTINYENISNSIRGNLIRNSFIFFRESSGLGVGAGNAVYYMKNYAFYDVHGVPYIHNWLIKILLEYGILIFIGYLIFYLTLFINLCKLYFTLTLFLEKIICEAIIMGLVSFPFIIFDECPSVFLKMWWIYVGFYLSFLNYCRLKYRQKAGENN